ncbi:uncharacterized protein LOC114264765 isoform X1 [Camellia sinensis]|uniref:uncharacterized protein LOC114264765 isoform X1 n=1 Tax=Camellia sinensis TaxID=4442 RepID=UPI001035CBED|nr:uncharacterized protein LOC114264765 isoform X1 [Camellia sinensis]
MSTTQGLGEHTVRVSTTVALSRGNLGLYWHQTGKEERIISRFGSTVVEHFWYYHCPLADIDYVPLYSTANKGYMFHYVLWQQIDGSCYRIIDYTGDLCIYCLYIYCCAHVFALIVQILSSTCVLLDYKI